MTTIFIQIIHLSDIHNTPLVTFYLFFFNSYNESQTITVRVKRLHYILAELLGAARSLTKLLLKTLFRYGFVTLDVAEDSVFVVMSKIHFICGQIKLKV